MKLHEITLNEALRFVRPGELRGSYSDQQMLAMGFRRSQNGSWYIDQRRWDQLVSSGKLKESWGPEHYPGILPIGDYLSPDSEFVDPTGKKDPTYLIQDVDDLINAGVEPRLITIKPSQVYATQDWLSNDSGDGPLYPEYADHPVVYQKGRHPSEAWYVLDGHHRITAALKQRRPIQVYLFTDQQLQQIKEAGEPSSPSRRGFLKKAAGAATMAAMPGQALKALATAPAAVSAATPVAAPMIAQLFQSAVLFGLKNGYDEYYNEYIKSEPEPEASYDGWRNMDPTGTEGEMPWNGYYEVKRTPKGRPYLSTSSATDQYGLFTFHDGKKIRNMEIYWDSGAWGELGQTDDPESEKIYWDIAEPTDEGTFNSTITHDDEGHLIDAIIDRSPEEFRAYKNSEEKKKSDRKDIAGQAAKSAATAAVRAMSPGTPAYLATLKNVIQNLVNKDQVKQQPAKDMGKIEPVSTAPTLPAPDKSAADIMAQLRDIVGRDLTDQEQDLVKQQINKDESV